MNSHISRSILRILIVLIFGSFATKCIASNDPPYILSLLGYLGQVKKDSLVYVKDANFYSGPLASQLNKPYYEKNIVTLKINEDSNFYLPPVFTATVKVRLQTVKYRSLTDSTVDTLTKTFVINYDSSHTYASRNSYIFDSCESVNAMITQVTITGTSLTTIVTNALVLEDQIQPYTDYKFSCTANAITSISVDNNTSRINSTGELLVNWPNIVGADQYDLEWVYIDQYALNSGVYGNAASPDSNFVTKIFLNNSTRITTSKLVYGIPLIFPDTGTLYMRVRSVQLKSDGSRLASNWSSKTLPGGLGSYYFLGHEDSLNWQSSITFAEDGKRKVVVQYYDGSLRSRQTVTKDNTVNLIDVAETFYDYQGRPTIQVLPVPTLTAAIQYTQLFNVANTGEYDKTVYDKLSSPSYYCDSSAPAMSTASGASNYYSTSNPSISGIERFIPDAGGYPFTQTQYTQDNTGRITKQSGVGPTFKIGSGHETKYFYGSPDQDELDALFGTEVGDKSHYFKNAVQDANGQISVSYVDMHGRTIATALAGGKPTGMDTISSYQQQTSITETLSDPSSTVIKDLVMESHKSIVVTRQGGDTLSFNYDLNPQSFTNKNCSQTDVCYNCLYDLQITVTDDCNNQHLPGGVAYVQSVYKGSLAAINDTCGKASAGIHLSFYVPVTAAGTYEITKKLSVSKYADDFYRNNVFNVKNTCKTQDTFVQQAKVILASSQCTPSYTACRDSLGTFSQFYSRYIVATGINPQTTDTTGLWKEVWQTYQNGLNACYELGDTARTDYDDIKRDMLMDVSAPGGQYANPDSTSDIYSIFHAATGLSYPRYQTPGIQYLDEFGNPDHVSDDNNGAKLVTPDKLDITQFARKFKDSWANALLPYHPEYCKLNQLNTYTASLAWNKDFQNTSRYADALSKGYLNPLGTSEDPISGTARTVLNGLVNTFVSQTGASTYSLSMNQVAILSVYCNATDNTCITNFYTSPKNYNDLSCDPARDMAWKNFRDIYLATKKRVIDSLISKAGCIPSSQTLVNAYRIPHFYTADSAVNMAGFSYYTSINATNQTSLSDSANNRLIASYTQTCSSYDSLWVQQLESCGAYSPDSIRQVIIPKLTAVCIAGSDVNHPLGSREIIPGSSLALGKYRTFDDVINDYNSTHGIPTNQYCNADIITYPGGYSSKPMTNTPSIPTYSKPDTCTCGRINQLYNEYLAFGSTYSSFSNYLLKRYNTNISQASLDTLLGMCNNTLTCNYVVNPITIPSILQCGSSNTCANCSAVENLYNSFISTYGVTPTRTETDTAQQRINTLFTNYMNTRLGFSKQAWEYLDFKSKCDSSGTSKCISCDSLQTLVNAYFNQTGVYGGTETDMLNYIRVKDSINGLVTTTDAIKTALNTCNSGWEKNMSWGPGGGKPYVFQGPSTSENMNIGDTLANGTPNPFTIETWANFQNTNNQQTVLYYLNKKNSTYIFHTDSLQSDACNTTTAVRGYYIYADTVGSQKYLFGYFADGVNNSRMLFRSYDPIISSHWYHIVITRTGNNYSDFKIYLDGQQTTTVFVQGATQLTKGNVTPIATTNGQIVNGDSARKRGLMLWHNAYTGGGGDYVSLRNVRLYARALSVTEIQSNYNNCDGSPSDTTGLRLWAKLNEGLGTPKDYSLKHVGGFLQLIQQSGGGCSCGNCSGQSFSSQDSTLNWRVVNGPVESSSCSLHYTSVLCNYPDTILLCGNANQLIADPNQITNCTDSSFLAVSAGTKRFNDYTDSLTTSFDSLYHSKCLQAYKYETFTVTHKAAEYHYTLYYYDQAGNLVKTIPPQGVIPNRTNTWLQSVKTARANGTTQVPTYMFATQYRYNSLNQIITQISPDGGTSYFYYDRLGRLAVSQNAKQVAVSDYSYNKYDAIGRIIEVGKIHSTSAMTRTISKTQSQLDTWFSGATSSRTEISMMHYDTTYNVSLAPYLSAINLRNRVSWIAVYPTAGSVDSLNHATATFYSYDIHGNVDTLLQDYKSGIMATTGNRFKKIVYQYDLISDKVNTVSYQPGQPDQFFHRYTYDAENRLTDVETSSDQLYWEHDMFYRYYKHGLLARMIIGDQQVQGVDFAYTLQGWFKGVNSTSLNTNDDMGGDGKSNSSLVARDAYGYAIEYYGYSDYTSISTAKKMFADGYANSNFHPLYNGNIAAISMNIQFPTIGSLFTSPLFYNYNYDQLNRLTKMQPSNGLNTSTNTWSPNALLDYKENANYDANGNIGGYLRNGTTVGGTQLAMDSLNYHYYYYKSNGTRKTYVTSSMPTDAAKLTNQLAYISDTVRSTNYTVDIDDQPTNDYSYDSIGNLTKDKNVLDSIYWTVYGKIAQINKHDGTTVYYTYDATGNRVSKIYNGVQTWYVRDASGNVMSVYTSGDTMNSGHLTQNEIDLFGSRRIGILKPNIDMTLTITMPGPGSKYFTTFTRGQKLFELTNHLGNVLVTITDKKSGSRSTSDTTKFAYYICDIVSSSDYYPFGQAEPGRIYTASATFYRYGFNEKEKDIDINGAGAIYDYGMRMYDARIGRFLSVDPLTPKYPQLTPYQFASNRTIDGTDRDGLEYVKEIPKIEYKGHWWDYVSAVDNGVIDILNTVPAFWNSAVGSYQSLKRGTAVQDIKTQFKQAGSAINQTATNIIYHPLKTLSSPEALEFLTSFYVGSKLPIPNGGKGNLMTPVQDGAGLKLSVDLPPGTQIAGFSFGKGSNLLPYSYQLGKCVEFASAFKSQFANVVESLGGQIKIFEINIGKNGLIGTAEQQLANNGLHQFIEVTIGKEVKIYDNFHPNGILKEDYIKQIAGHTNDGKIIEGEQLINTAKEVKK